ncbi:hypothetical protein CEUSTIGMA_g1619.t1 [Chlamydomonas eustigma]|uniref:Uncharacterized protein n=1 Tax=Chlamydomonas eustigma TaxID=1157962 RepID=A0A250WUD4_9CHLO|nr:hypothetical protein CEUSTIGMA_g1619.t1 [Chlamydomonas eustigma]|eukprot:GAX74170.1 hypothetical protein CEUSTIGMA_g1619.t1 [Chlamydomonas eustigma]
MLSDEVIKLGAAGQRSTSHFFGSVSIVLTCVPYALATALQYHGIEVALIAGTAASGALALLRVLLFYTHLCQVPVQILDTALLVALAVQLGVSFPYRGYISDYFNFILNGTLALVSLYLVPVSRGLLSEPSDPQNYIFRIILPIALFLAAAVFTFMLPASTTTILEQSIGFDSSDVYMYWRNGPGPPLASGVTRVTVNPLAQP